jgi:hypothetical protein
MRSAGRWRPGRERRLPGVKSAKSNVSDWPTVSDRFSARKLPVSPKKTHSRTQWALSTEAVSKPSALLQIERNEPKIPSVIQIRSRQDKPGKGGSYVVAETIRWNPVGLTPIRERLTTDRKAVLHASAATHYLKRRRQIPKPRDRASKLKLTLVPSSCR